MQIQTLLQQIKAKQEEHSLYWYKPEQHNAVVALIDEVEQLRRWKAEQLAVTPDLQAIGKAIGVGMGQSVHDKILPAINALKSKLEKKDALLEEMSRVINSALALPMISQYFSEKMNTLLTKYKQQKA